MKKEHLLMTIFLGIVAVSFYLFYRLLAPFLVPLCWAAIFAIIFYPLYQKIEKYINSPNLRSLLLTLLIVLLIIGPAVYIGTALVQEAITTFDHFRAWVDEGNLDKLIDIKNSPMYLVVQDKLEPYVDISQLDLRVIIEKSLQAVSRVALTQTTKILTNAGIVIFHFFLMVFFMFYFFRDGSGLLKQIKSIIPISPDKTESTFNHLRKVIEGTMYGGVVVALIQGFLGGLLFLIMGLPSPVFWGAFMAFLAFVPVVGPFLVYIPAGIILIFSGSIVKGILLLILGTVIVSQIDNFLRPLLVSGKTGMHTMLLFISIMGGIGMFGLLGVVLGPFIAAVFVTMFDVFRLKLTEDEKIETKDHNFATDRECK
ncbi:MAG: AI-2E family transporter [candidate division Zixibacteria bacterium]